MPSKRTSKENQEFGAILAEYGVTPINPFLFYDVMYNFFRPEKEQSTEEVILERLNILTEAINNMQPGMNLTMETAKQVTGLSSRSDVYKIRQFLNKNNILQPTGATAEGWVKRLTNDTVGNAD